MTMKGAITPLRIMRWESLNSNSPDRFEMIEMKFESWRKAILKSMGYFEFDLRISEKISTVRL